MQRTEGLSIRLIELIAILALGMVSPYFSILVIWYLGLLALDWLPPLWRLGLGPAVGMGIVIVTTHLISLIGLPLWMSVPVIYFLTLFFWLKRSNKVSLLTIWGDVPLIDRLFLLVSVFLSAGFKIPVLAIPAYSSAPKDPIFHAYKAWEILREGTIFIRHKPIEFSGILNYPAGYHSLISWISLTSGVEVPFSMEALKIFTWVFIPLGSYLAARELFGKEDVARVSAVIASLTYLYYYYLHYSLLHLFLSYYLFLCAVAVYTKIISRYGEKMDVSNNDLILIVLVVVSLLLVHPYPYLLFQAYAILLLLVYLISSGYLSVPSISVFMIQLFGSYIGYYILEYPNRLGIEKYTKPLFNVPGYALKDNPHWLEYILKQTFWDNGQFIFLPFFILGTGLMIKKRSKNGFALLLTVAFAFFLIFDKIWFHVNIPFYSAIWNSERIYILLTPVFPLFIAYGLGSFWRLFSIPRKGLVALALLLLIPAFYVNVDNYSRELCSTIDSSTLIVFEGLRGIKDPIYIPNFKDSGYWIPLFTGKQIRKVTMIPSGGILYIDSRGFGDLRLEPINPLAVFNRSALVMYQEGIWLFNLSKSVNASSFRAMEQLYSTLTLNDNTIDGSHFEDWRYFTYGFLLRHPVVVRGILLKQWKGVFSIVNNSYVVFVPDRDYSFMRIVGLGDHTRIYLNGVHLGVLNNKPVSFRITMKKGKLYILRFEGKVYIEKIILQG